jgi:hypothetical protein
MPDEDRKNGKKTGPGSPPVEYQFKPGNPGRPKGSRNKLGEAFLEDMLADWEANGPAAIREVRETKPDAYLKVVASILPRDLNVNVNQTDHMTDEQLVERIRSLDAAIRPFLDTQGEGGTYSGAGPAVTH